MSEFDKYIVQGEPDKKAKANAWQTAIGLQDVDGPPQQVPQQVPSRRAKILSV